MNASEMVAKVSADLRPHLPPSIASALKFHPPEELLKYGVRNTGVRILGKQAGKVWAGRWCFYNVSVGPDHNNMRRSGGAGFGCGVNQKPCGGGKHEAALLDIAARFCKTHPQFHHSSRGSSWLSIAIPYYPSAGCIFPIDQATQDLATLITDTFDAIDALVV